MKIENGRFMRAMEILPVLEKAMLSSDIKANVWYEAYSNGREQGMTVVVSLFGVKGKLSVLMFAFAENRNSDHLVLYTGNNNQFLTQGNVPHPDVYEARRMFSPGDQVSLVTAIMQTIATEYATP